jgi:hypothetical protein
MRYNANSKTRNCLAKECQCKGCPFNGIDEMCLGCNECIEHKQLAPVTNCNIVKKGDWNGFCAIALHDSYMISIPTGIADIPEYFEITKEEFDTFEEWRNNEPKIIEIENREGLKNHK